MSRPTHDDVHSQVEDNDDPLLDDQSWFSLDQSEATYHRGLALELSEAENGSSSVVEDVEEC